MDVRKIKLRNFPLLPFLQTIWKSRTDLQEQFIYPDCYETGNDDFLEWFINNAPNEYHFDESSLLELRQEFNKEKLEKRNEAIKEKGNRIQNDIKNFLKYSRYEKGVNLFAFIRGDFGVGEGGRRTAASLATTDIDFNILDLYRDYIAHQNTNRTWENKIVEKPVYDINVFHCNPLELMDKGISREILQDRYNIGYWVWELPTFPDVWVPYFKLFDEIWTPSTFSAESIAGKAFCPVIRVPHSIEVQLDEKITREYFGLPEDKFLFLFMYDSFSWIERKNPQAVIEAFKRAFKNNENVGLVVKVSNSKHGHDDIKKLEELRKTYKNIYIIDKVLPKAEVNSLLNCCDVFVSLHRSEGFGLGLAEAMYLRKPVIGTGWSGNTDFMRNNNSCLVKYNFIPVEVNYANINCDGQYWADADVDDAAKYMYKLYSDKDFYNEIATNGHKTIIDEFSAEAVGKIIKERIDQIRK